MTICIVIVYDTKIDVFKNTSNKNIKENESFKQNHTKFLKKYYKKYVNKICCHLTSKKYDCNEHICKRIPIH